MEAAAIWIKVNDKKFAIDLVQYLIDEFMHCTPPGGDLFSLYQSGPRFAGLMIATWDSGSDIKKWKKNITKSVETFK